MLKILVVLFLSASLYAAEKQIHYIVKHVNVRSSSSIGKNILFTLPKGATKLKILQEKEGKLHNWSEVVFLDGKKGWVVSDYIKTIDKNFALAFYEKMGNVYRLRIWHPMTTVVDEVFTVESGMEIPKQQTKEDAVVSNLLLHLNTKTDEMYVYDRFREKTIFKVSNVVDAFWVSNFKGLKRIRGHIIIW